MPPSSAGRNKAAILRGAAGGSSIRGSCGSWGQQDGSPREPSRRAGWLGSWARRTSPPRRSGRARVRGRARTVWRMKQATGSHPSSNEGEERRFRVYIHNGTTWKRGIRGAGRDESARCWRGTRKQKGSGGVEMGRRGAGREAAARWGRRAGGGATASVRRAPGSRVCALIYIYMVEGERARPRGGEGAWERTTRSGSRRAGLNFER